MSRGRAERREFRAKKRALAIRPHRRYSAEEKELILETVQQAKERTGQPTYQVLAQLGLSEATYYRWQVRRRAAALADQIGHPGRRVPPPTPAEEESVCAYSLTYPQVGYKRLTWQMIDQDVVYLRPYQVYAILGEHDLLQRRSRNRAESLRRPAEPDRPDQVWHVDLMYLYVVPRWYYLVDVTAARQKLDGAARKVPDGIHALIVGGDAALHNLQVLVAQAAGDETLLLPEADLTLGPSVTAPEKILCIGLNYERHARETGAKIPAQPVLFSKFNNALAAHGEAVPIPPGTAQMDYEAELAVVIGRQARHIGEVEALDYVFGYCNANDVSARDLQMLSGQWLLGKTPDRFLPLGPYLVTADEVPDPQSLRIAAYVNGEQRQASTTGDMIFSVAQVISYISRYITLQPGDVISTGTPEGVALAMNPQPWLQPGDEVVIEVESLGRLKNRIAAS